MDTTLFPSTKSDHLKGPAINADSLQEKYSPVACDFSDELEFLCMKRIRVSISFWDEQKVKQTKSDVIVDIINHDKQEFLKLSDETLIRLDRISAVDILH